MSYDQEKERIKYLTEIYKSFIILIIALGGGLSSVLLKETKTDIDFTLLYLGSIIFVIIVCQTIFTSRDIKTLIKKL